jgi:hypothetical protein
MGALVVLGMSNLWLIVVAAAALLVYKVTDWGALVPVFHVVGEGREAG